MKGKKKYIVPLLLAGVTASAGLVTSFEQQQTIVQAQEATQSKTIDNIAGAELKMVGGFDDNGYMLGNVISMPAVTVDGKTLAELTADDYKVTYSILRGEKVVKEITSAQVIAAGQNGASAEAIKAGTFAPTYTGVYNVKIKAEKQNVIVSEIDGLKIVVSKSDAVINLPVNSKYVIPARIATNEDSLKIPAPSVLVGDDGEAKEGSAAIAAGLKVQLVTPGQAGIIDITEQFESETNTFDVLSTQLSTPGTYQIRYEFHDGDILVTKLDSNFQVVDAEDFTAPTKLYMKLSGSVPTTGDVNTDITLPKVTVYDSKNSTDPINAHVTVKVIKLDTTGKEVSSVEIKDYEDYTFHPTEEGNYIVSYSADLDELYDLSSDIYKPSTIIHVKDSKAPSVVPTYSYRVETNATTQKKEVTGYDKEGNGYVDFAEGETAEDVLVNRKVDVPTVAVLKDGVAEFDLPAIFGFDNKYDYENLTFTRIVSGNGTTTQTFTGADYPANEVVENVKLYKTGTYEIRYIVKENATNGIEKKATFSLTVVDEATAKKAEGTTVKLNMNISTSSVSDKDTLKLAPTAEDGLDDFVDVETGYVLVNEVTEGGKLVKKEIASTKTMLTKTNADGKFEISILNDIIKNADYEGLEYTHIRVFADATVDSTLEGVRNSVVTTASKDLLVRDSSNDDTAPGFKISVLQPKADANDPDVYADTDGTYTSWNKALFDANKSIVITKNGTEDIVVKSIDAAGYALNGSDGRFTTSEGGQLAAFNQNSGILELPAVKFTDDDEHVKVRVSIYDAAGNTESKFSSENAIVPVKNTTTGLWEYTIDGVSFNLSQSEVYTVVYRAEDTAGNVTIRSFGIRVNNTTPPDIAIADRDKFGMDIEVGEFFEVPTAILKKGNIEYPDRDVFWQVTYSDGTECDIQATGFTPLTEGTYYIKYYGTDSMGNYQELEDKTLYFVNAKDTKAPEFDENLNVDLPSIMAWPTDAEEVNIDIPVVFATDPIINESIDVKYVVKSPDDKKVDILDYDMTKPENAGKENVRYFIAKKQGVYTVEYTATDKAGNTQTLTKKIALGDCAQPTLSWKNDNVSIPKTVALNSTLELKLSDLVIKDNESKPEDVKIKVKLIKPDKTTELKSTGEPDRNYIWKLTETGDYKLSIVITDEAGNTNSDYEYIITVPAEDTDTNEISPVWGTVLVVASVVILAGVVIYFVVSSRKKTTPKSSRSRKKD